MEIREMYYYKTIVEEGSILKASKKLYVAQPALSRLIKKLETEFNDILFERNKGIKLTQKGKILYEKCNHILSLYEESILEVKNTNIKTLKLGIVSSSTKALLNTLEHFKKENMYYEIKEGNTYQLIEYMRLGIINLAIVRTPFDQTDFDTTFIKSEKMSVIYHKPLDNEINLSYLNSKPLIIYKRFKSLIENEFSKKNLKLEILALVEDAKTAALLALKMDAYAIVPTNIIHVLNKEGLYQASILDKELETTLGITHLKNKKLEKFELDFIESFNL